MIWTLASKKAPLISQLKLIHDSISHNLLFYIYFKGTMGKIWPELDKMYFFCTWF